MKLQHAYIFMNFKELFTFENLNNAFYETAKISYWKEATQRYKANLFHNNLELQDDLMNGTYKVSATTNFRINERGKIRNIEAPAIRDRIVQKAKSLETHLKQRVTILN